MGTVLGIAGMAVAGYLLLKTVRAFQNAWQEAEIARTEAVPQQVVRLETPGEMALCLEGPKFRTYSKRLQYEILDERSGRPVPVTPVFTGAGVRSLTRNRVQRGRFTLPAPGNYILRIAGLAVGDQADFAIVFMRPFTGTLLRFIFACVALGMALLGCLMLAIFSAVF